MNEKGKPVTVIPESLQCLFDIASELAEVVNKEIESGNIGYWILTPETVEFLEEQRKNETEDD